MNSKESGMPKEPVCEARNINHVCIAVRDIEDTLRFYRDVFGVGKAEVKDIEDQGVRAAMVRVGDYQIEFIQPVDNSGSVARFIERRGEGVHHICFEVEGLEEKLSLLADEGIELIDREPRKGFAGMVAFIHPKATRGVLIELVDRETARRQSGAH